MVTFSISVYVWWLVFTGEGVKEPMVVDPPLPGNQTNGFWQPGGHGLCLVIWIE